MTELKAKNIILATGATAAMIPGVAADGEKVLTYSEAILQDQAARVGGDHRRRARSGSSSPRSGTPTATTVTMVEMLPRILPLEDEEVSAELAKAYQKRGIKVLTAHAGAESCKPAKTGCPCRWPRRTARKPSKPSRRWWRSASSPTRAALGWKKWASSSSERGFVEIDERMATNVPGIWAIGDVTGKLLLAHVASAQGIVCAENIAGAETVTLDYRMMPRATYSSPQVASFGLTEAQAKEQGYTSQGRALQLPSPMAKRWGWAITPVLSRSSPTKSYGEILGAHLVGPDVIRAAARAHPGAAHGADAGRNRPQRACPSDAERSPAGSRPRRRRTRHSYVACRLRTAARVDQTGGLPRRGRRTEHGRDRTRARGNCRL